MSAELRGCYPILATPFRSDGEVDEESVVRLGPARVGGRDSRGGREAALKIRIFGDLVLRLHTAEVKDVGASLGRLSRQMLYTMRAEEDSAALAGN